MLFQRPFLVYFWAQKDEKGAVRTVSYRQYSAFHTLQKGDLENGLDKARFLVIKGHVNQMGVQGVSRKGAEK